MDAIINQAMAGHIHAFVERLRLVASRYEDSVERFWAVVNDYVVCFDELPNAATLWLEYWIDSVRRQRVVALQRTVEPISILLVELLEALPVRARPEAAHALLSYLLGTVLQQRVRQVPSDQPALILRRQAANLPVRRPSDPVIREVGKRKGSG